MPNQHDTIENSAEQKTRPRGGQPGNHNNRKHGLNSQQDKLAIRHGFTIGRLPKKFSSLERSLLAFREKLEAAVQEAHGKEITITQASHINMATQAYAMVLKARRYYRDGYYRVTKGDDDKEVLVEALSLDQKLKLDRVILDGTIKMNKAIRALGLEKGGQNSLASMYVDDPEDDEDPDEGDDED
jgi:hypothetical protein